ncbi:MAG TPA: ATP-binding protein [Methanospirillum sp.]|nr:ATP-binding protein [Methanospirillum sp.]
MIGTNTGLDLPFFLDTVPVGICIITHDYTIEVWNRTLEIWTGLVADQIEGQNLGAIVPELLTPLIRDRFSVAFAGGGPIILSSRFHPHIFPLESKSQNEGRYQRITIIPFDLLNHTEGAMIVVEDVTAITEQVFTYRYLRDQIRIELEERKKAEKALAIANSKLNTLASVSRHDLQNLLTAFEGYVTFSLEEKPEGKIKTYLEKMELVTQVMKKQLAFTRDYQDLGIHAPAWFRIDELIRSSVQGPFFSGVEYEITTGTLEVLADPLIVKAMYNLVENAVRHGKHTTHIRVFNFLEGDRMKILVADNGAGVPHSIKNRIFERGFGSNTGLGLFLTRDILGITGIEIHETGVEGLGGQFEILIPPGQFRYA